MSVFSQELQVATATFFEKVYFVFHNPKKLWAEKHSKYLILKIWSPYFWVSNQVFEKKIILFTFHNQTPGE